MHPVLRSFRFTLALALVLIALPALAASPVANVDLGFNSVTWTPQNEFAGLRLTVSGPDGTTWQNNFDANEAPQLDLSALGSTVDGLYTWELRATPIVDQNKMLATSRTSEAGTRVRPAGLPPRDSLVQSGSFRVLNGTIVQPATEQPAPRLVVDAPGVESATAGLERATAADNVILDDQIVDGSLCVGMDCINGESFGFDTVRLKENNLRIHFDDTSNSGSFPSNDWRIVINGSQNGDPSYFRVEDSTSGRNPFTVEAGAQNHNLYVEADGDVGIKTSEPVVDLHIVEGNTPTLRLDQDGSDGFSPQIWDIAGNEANFFIRDVTSGSKLVFRAKPGAPEDSIFIAADGDVGMGTDAPTADLHVQANSSDFTRLLQLDNLGTGSAAFRINNSTDSVDLNITENSTNGETEFRININSSPQELTLQEDGDLIIKGNLFVQNNQQVFPDYVFEDDYELMTLAEVQAFIDENGHLPGVVSRAEVETQGNFSVNGLQVQMLEKLEEVVLYTLAQEREIQSLKAQLNELKGAAETVEQ